MLRQLLNQTGITVRARYNESFFAWGKRHMLADADRIGWHPDFESRLVPKLSTDIQTDPIGRTTPFTLVAARLARRQVPETEEMTTCEGAAEFEGYRPGAAYQ